MTLLGRAGSTLVKAPGVCRDDVLHLRRGGGRGRRASRACGLFALGLAFSRFLSLAVLLRVHLLLYVLPREIPDVRPPSWVHLRVRNASRSTGARAEQARGREGGTDVHPCK